MTPAPPILPLTRDLVLVGGGHAHALLLRRWGMDPLPGARLTVINPGPTAPYTGMLPGFVAGHYDREELEIDLVRLARFAGARLILDSATGLDRDRCEVRFATRPPVAYDVVSLDIGIHSAMPDLEGFARHGHPAKPLGPYAAAWSRHLSRLASEPGASAEGIAVIGAGVGGVELAMAMRHGSRASGAGDGPIHVIDSGTALAGLSRRAAAILVRQLDRMGITLIENASVARLTEEAVILTDGRRLASAFTVGAAGARPYAWLSETGLPLHDGYVRVDETLRALGDPLVFAVGDCAHMDHAPRPKAGVFAVRQAPVLHANLRAALGTGRWREYHPQRDYLKLVSLGGKSALADKFGIGLHAPLLWRWKDHIDRTFMRRLADLPAMPVPPLPPWHAQGLPEAVAATASMCGGCGSKLGQGSLATVLAALPAAPQGDLEPCAGDDAAVLRIGGTRQVLSTDHLRALTDDPYVMGRIAACHALGDVFAMGAEPSAALVTVILPRASEVLHVRMLTEAMRGAAGIVSEAGGHVVGGHTMIGDALSIGLAVTGLVDRPITLAGARPGDALILTKPIGTGVIMAAEMRGEARGPFVAGALAAMQVSQASAARALGQARAMTDVTGFGLAGHLMNLLRAAGVGARIEIGAVPLLDGALVLSRAGHRSTLHAANAEVSAQMVLPDDPRCDLLFDPQTAGGLLAAVPPEQTEAILGVLGAAGHPAVWIGTVTPGPARIDVQ